MGGKDNEENRTTRKTRKPGVLGGGILVFPIP